MSVEADDLRSTLAEAWDKSAEAAPEPTNTPEPVEAPASEAPTGEAEAPRQESTAEGEAGETGKSRDDKGRFTAAAKDSPPPAAKPDGDKGVQTPSAASQQGDLQAPLSWKSAAKAEWGKIPRAAQEEIARREVEATKALSLSTNSRKFTDEFNQTIAPFMPLIRAQNSTPMQAVKNLMTTSAGLTVGTPEQKARIVRDIIANFGVDIQMLDQVLSQNLPQGSGAPGTNPMEIQIQRALAPVYQFMDTVSNQRQAAQQRVQQEADRAVEEFAAKNEFFDELREDIADLMELHASRGRELTLQRAYDMAVQMHPEYGAVVQQRQAANGAKNSAATIQKARNAASSIRGAPMNEPVKPEGQRTVRDDLMDAWDNSAGR